MQMRILLILALLIFSGCSLNLIKPEVELANINLSEVSLFNTAMDLAVQIDNENQDSITIKNSVHRLYLNDIYLGKGFSNSEVTVPPFSRSIIDVDLQLSNIAIGRLINDALGKNTLEYRLESSLYLEGGIFPIRYESERKGTIANENLFKERTAGN